MLWFALACQAPAPPPDAEALVADAGPSRVAPVGVPVRLDGRSSTGAVAYDWDLGDGTRSTEPSPTHIYTTPGNRSAILRVTGPDGQTRTASTRVTIHPRLAATPPVASGTLMVGPDGRVWGFVRDANTVFVTDGTYASRIRACLDPDGAPRGQPVGLTVIPELTTLCDPGDDTPPWLLHFPVGSRERLDVPLPVGSRPAGLTHRDGVWTASLAGTGQIARVTNLSTVGLTDVGPDPRALIETDAGRFTARFRSPAEHGELFGPSGVIELPYDPGPDSDTGSRGVPNLLSLAASPDGRTAFVTGTLSNTARGTWRDGQALTFETTLRAFFSILDLTTGEEIRRRPVDDQGRGGAMVVSPLGNLVYVAFPGTHTVIAFDAFTGEIAGSLLDVGRGVDGLALTDEGATLWVNATLDREIHAYDVSDLSRLPTRAVSFPTVTDDPLDPQILRGKQLFNDAIDPRLAKDGYVACAGCHPDGDHDGQTWDFTDRGEGLRNTTSLLGRAGTGMGPVHWTGNFDEIQDFEHDIRGSFGGTGLMSDADFALTDAPLGPPKAGLSEDLDALAAYVATLDRTPVSPFAEPDGGAALFDASGCVSCHPPPLFTDSALDVRHDIGTLTDASGGRLGGPLDGLDTPTLLGAWDGAPWLHDGSAPTLRAAIEAHAGAPTDPAELDLLADYVRSL